MKITNKHVTKRFLVLGMTAFTPEPEILGGYNSVFHAIRQMGRYIEDLRRKGIFALFVVKDVTNGERVRRGHSGVLGTEVRE